MLNKIVSNKGFLKYFNNTIWMILEQFLRIISGLVIGIWIARYLGPENYGTFSFSIAFTSILAGFAKLGLDGVVVRELVNNPEKKNQLLGTSFILKFISSIILNVIIFSFIFFSKINSETIIFILILNLGYIFQSFEVIDFYYQSILKAKILSICKIIQLLVSGAFKIILIYNDSDLIWFIIATLSDYIILSITYYLSYILYTNHNFLNLFDKNTAISLLKDSWPLIFSSIVIMLYMRVDQIMIGQMLNDHEVGIYSTAVKISEVFFFVPVILNTSLFPAILNAKKISKKLYYLRLKKLYSVMIWLGIIISILISLLGDNIIYFLYGNEYIKSIEILKILIWSNTFVFIGLTFGKYLLTENLTKISFLRTSAGALLNIIANLILIPKYGIIGAAYATLIAQFTANLGFDIFYKSLHNHLLLKIESVYFPFSEFVTTFKSKKDFNI